MSDWMQTLQETTIVGNELWRVVSLFGVVLVSFVVGKLFQWFFNRSSARFNEAGKKFVATTFDCLARSVVLVVFSFALRQGMHVLTLNPKVAELSNTLTGVLAALAVGWTVYCLVDLVDVWLGGLAAKTVSRMDDMLAPLVRKSLRVTIVVLTLVQVAQIVSDKPITSILAGLGVGGLAIALAAQDSIKNLFGSIVIFADKPFELGDRIVVDGIDGPVEEVGFRSTKVRTFDGYLVTIPNGELANKTIQNAGKRPYIRHKFDLGLTYSTSPEKIREAVDMVRRLLNDHDGMNPDLLPRVYFNELKADSLNVSVMFWYPPTDYKAFLAFVHQLNLDIVAQFHQAGIEFAFPTRTVHLVESSS